VGIKYKGTHDCHDKRLIRGFTNCNCN